MGARRTRPLQEWLGGRTMFDGGWLLHDREIDGMLSGTVEAVLHALIRLRLKRVVTQVAVTETLQQATGQIGEAAEQLPRRAAAFRRQRRSKLPASKICRII